MVYLGLYTAAVLFLSGLLGWLMHFGITPFITSKRTLNKSAMAQSCPRKFIGDRNPATAIFWGILATIFAALLTGFKGLQFWAVWFCHDKISAAYTGSHSWSTFHFAVVLFLVSGTNAAAAALLSKYLFAEKRSLRLRAITVAGVLLASLLISAENFGLHVGW